MVMLVFIPVGAFLIVVLNARLSILLSMLTIAGHGGAWPPPPFGPLNGFHLKRDGFCFIMASEDGVFEDYEDDFYLDRDLQVLNEMQVYLQYHN